MLCVGTISGGLPDVFFRFTDLKVMLNQSDPIQEYPCCEAHKRLDDLEQVIHEKAYTKFRRKPSEK